MLDKDKFVASFKGLLLPCVWVQQSCCLAPDNDTGESAQEPTCFYGVLTTPHLTESTAVLYRGEQL